MQRRLILAHISSVQSLTSGKSFQEELEVAGYVGCLHRELRIRAGSLMALFSEYVVF